MRIPFARIAAVVVTAAVVPLADSRAIAQDTTPLDEACAMLRSRDTGQVSRACRALVHEGSGAVPALRELRRDESWEIRGTAVFLLGEIGSRDVLPDLMDALDDPSWVVRHHATAAIGRIAQEPGRDDARTQDALLECLDDPVWAIRRAAAQALRLRAFEKETVNVALERVARQDPDVDVRETALRTLVAVRSNRAVPLLAERFDRTEGDERLDVLEDLWRFPLDQARPLIQKALESADRWVRVVAASRLIRERDPSPLESVEIREDLLLALMDPGTPHDARRAAWNALGAAGLDAVPHLRAALADATAPFGPSAAERIVERIVLNLGQYAPEALSGMLADPSLDRAHPAILRQLGGFASPSSLAPILAFLEGSPEPDARRRALETLRAYPVHDTRSAFRHALQDKDAWIRTLAVRFLAGTGDSADFEAAVGVVRNETAATTRAKGAEALSEHRGAVVIPSLMRFALEDPDPGVRRQAVLGIARHAGAADPDTLLPFLRNLLDSNVPPIIRAAALQAVGAIESPDAVAILFEIAGDDGRDPELRRGALVRLGRLGPEGLAETILPLAENPRTVPLMVRRAAVAAAGPAATDESCRTLLQLIERDPELRTEILRVLQGTACRDAAVVLIRALVEGRWDRETRFEAVETLATLGAEDVAGPLLDLAGDPAAEPDLRIAAVRALGEVRDPRPVADLLEMLRVATGDGAAADIPSDPASPRLQLVQELVTTLCRLADLDGVGPEGVREAVRVCIRELVREAGNPEAYPVWNRTLVHAVRSLEPDHAVTEIEDAFEAARGDGSLYYLGEDRFFQMAEAARFASMPRIAASFYRRVQATCPSFTKTDFRASVELGRILEAEGLFRAAAASFLRAATIAASEGFSLEPRGLHDGIDPEARIAGMASLLSGVACIREDEDSTARTDLLRALDVADMDRTLQVHCARYLIDLDAFLDLAQRAASTANTLSPDTPDILETLAETHVLLGDTRSALEHYHRMIHIPGLPADMARRFLLRAAELEETAGDPTRSQELRRRADARHQ